VLDSFDPALGSLVGAGLDESQERV
jgi:hypothetical protein